MYLIAVWTLQTPSGLPILAVGNPITERAGAHVKASSLARAGYDLVFVIELTLDGVRLVERHTPGRYEDLSVALPAYDPQFDGEVCQCGHPYERHFDSYEDMSPVGCKYCECREFRWAVLAC